MFLQIQYVRTVYFTEKYLLVKLFVFIRSMKSISMYIIPKYFLLNYCD